MRSICVHNLHVSLYGCTAALVDLGRFLFLNLYTVGRTPWTGDRPFARPLPTYRTAQTQNKRTQKSMPRVGFEPITPVFERAKTVHALDRATTVIAHFHVYHRVKGGVTNECVLMVPQSEQTVNRSVFSRAGKEVGLRSGTGDIFEGKLMARVGSGQVKLQYFGLCRTLFLSTGVFPWKTKNLFSALLLL
jgi:hypothetical protein